MPNADPAALRCDGLGKSFSGVCVVRGVSFSLGKGRILGLVGENGAGKSTLMNIVGGVLAPDAGRMHLHGKPYAPSNPMEASGRGVAFVHQELNLFGNLSIADNLFITGFAARRILGLPFLDRRTTDRRTRELLASVELLRAPETLVESLSQGERQLVEIAKALRADASLIIFDEPTTSLTAPETRRLFGMIERLRAAGISIVYISHTLDDVLELSDDILVLRDGEVAGAGPKTGFSEGRLITLMVGRSIEQMFPARSRAGSPDAVLELRGVSQPGIVENVSFTLRRSEILGVSGLMGSGRSELARIIFGLDPAETGEILLEGEALGGATPRERIRRGMALLTESRR
ncbi:MAG: sugar ABC transporter ATP-binding protein, partial [Acidobacteriota bacterium]